MSEDRKMRVILDSNICAGHGRCYELAPDVFEEDERGHCVVKTDLVAPEFQDAARRAVINCPEDALELEEGSED